MTKETIDHPPHYGGDTVYETIKVIEAWDLNYSLGNAVKYISRAGKKGSRLEDLKKAAWYLNHEIEREKALEAAAHEETELFRPDLTRISDPGTEPRISHIVSTRVPIDPMKSVEIPKPGGHGKFGVSEGSYPPLDPHDPLPRD